MRFFKIFLLNFQDVLTSRMRSFIWFLLALINPLVTLIFWIGFLKDKGNTLQGWVLPTLTSYYLLLIVAGATLIAHVEEDVAVYDIKEGGLVRFLTRPISYYYIKLFSELPWRLFQGVFGVVAFIFFFIFFNKYINFHIGIQSLILTIIMAVFAFLISFTFKMILGILAFWLTDFRGIQQLLEVITIILAGFVMPIDLFPNWLRTLSLLTPFPYIIYFPVQSFLGKFTVQESFQIIITQVFWLLFLILIYKVLWRNGLRKFSGVGQ